MKINIIDEADRQQTLSYIKGFKTGRNNTITQIIDAKTHGVPFKKIYKTIHEIYKKEVQHDANINHEY